jgi:hypothetical protein
MGYEADRSGRRRRKKPGWSMQADRMLMRLLTRDNPDVDRIAAELKKTPASVVRSALRLGIYLPSIWPKRGRPG